MFRFVWGSLHLVSWRYLHRLFFLLILATFNSLLGLVEHVKFARKIQAQKIHPEILFILGHPRTGTTHLHNIISQDPRFGHVTTLQAGFPNCCLLMGRRFIKSWLQRFFIDDVRPMDNLPLNFDTPAEDEIAVNVLSGGISPYAALSFMPNYRRLLQYCTFENCPAELSLWKQSFIKFLKKISYACGGKPLVIKSPVHMGRIKTILELFPQAKFIMIHRHPVTVFKSSAHMIQEYFTYCFLAETTRSQLTDYILMQHQLLYKSYFENRNLIPSESLQEISFTQLEQDPHGVIKEVYKKFEWAGIDDMPHRIQGYLDHLGDFKKNDHKQISPDLHDRIEECCREMMEEFGYTVKN